MKKQGNYSPKENGGMKQHNLYQEYSNWFYHFREADPKICLMSVRVITCVWVCVWGVMLRSPDLVGGLQRKYICIKVQTPNCIQNLLDSWLQ